jgi:arsenite methyltransferase
MASTSGQPMYENGSLREATGGPLRPGGLDLTERLLELCKLFPGDMVLDVGCGNGATVRHLIDDFSVYAIGIDRSELLLQTGIFNDPRLPLACAWGKALPIPSGEINAVLAECSLSAMSEFENVLSEFHRVLRPGGRLAASDIYARNPDGVPGLHVLPLSCGLRNAITRHELVTHLKAYGFEVEVWEDHAEELKYLGGQITLAHGSVSEFWSRSEPAADPMDLMIAISKAKLSYYLLIARKV